MKTKFLFSWHCLLFMIAVYSVIQAKVIIMVNSVYYYTVEGYRHVNNYVTDVNSIDGTPAELLVWYPPDTTKTIREKCFPLWQTLQQKYIANRHVPPTDQDITGAVFIGQLPIPKFKHVNGTGYYDYPHDYYFMDLWNQNTSTPYPSDTTIWQYRPDLKAFYGPSYESNGYKASAGDNKLDIWMTRICAEDIDHLRDTNGVILTQYEILNQYLDRVHKRMTEPATVPPRSLSFGSAHHSGPENLGLEQLGLNFHTSFDNAENINAMQLVTQLQNGPHGNVCFGASNGTRFPYQNKRTTFPCYHSSIFNKNQNVWEETTNDSRGYEWVGVKGHGSPFGFTMFSPGGEGHINGGFSSFSIAPYLGSQNCRFYDSRGINGSYFRFKSADFPEPWWRDGKSWTKNWHGINAIWKFYMPVKGTYDIYMNYPAELENVNSIKVHVEHYPVKNRDNSEKKGTVTISQRTHQLTSPPGSNWEFLNRVSFRNDYDTAIVILELNGVDTNMYCIVDAVKFTGVPGTSTEGDTIIVDNEKSYDNNFKFSNWTDRAFLDMQDESYHKAYSKTPFFLAQSCHLHEYTARKGSAGNNMGLLFAMAHNGLISMGTVTNNSPYNPYYVYIQTIRDTTKSFGDAFLNMANSSGITGFNYIMFGAGTLRARAYVPFPESQPSVLLEPANGEQWATLQQTFRWSKSQGAVSYRLVIFNNGSITCDFTDISDTVFTIPSGYLNKGKFYDWKVCTVNFDTRNWSKVSRFRTGPGVPECIIPVYQQIVSGRPYLKWSSFPDAVSWRVQVSDNIQFTNVVIDTILPRYRYDFTIKQQLYSDKMYFWRVNADYASYGSEWSSSSAFITSMNESVPGSNIIGILIIFCITIISGTLLLIKRKKMFV